MARSNDHPNIPFMQASGYSAGRPDGKPLWIVVHDMEASETLDRALSTARYFATGAGGRNVSSHYCVDGSEDGDGSDPLWQCVDLDDSAWTVGNRPGNMRGINWELAGFASQSGAQWLDPYGRRMFGRMAPVVQSDGDRFGIPLVRRSVAELEARKPGITSHNDLRLAFGVTTHTDPGPNFPWELFIETMRGNEMPLSDKQAFKQYEYILNMGKTQAAFADGKDSVELIVVSDTGQESKGPTRDLTPYWDRVARTGGGVDEATVRELIEGSSIHAPAPPQ